ncbi:MAG: sigma 54-interacting transcriptional regulator [Gammaproteobacteria bacterium]|nr:sigma 54-interacting transcriptional regulator [Gammaproteobacteria bacterium]NNJ96991.1 sigma 54-interacting transcriptional regulator [Gammaproteobacteria bacterium]
MALQKILLVDDDVSLLKLLSIRLKSAGYEIEVAENAHQALARLAFFQPHLVITDLRMGDMNGLALFDRIHQQYPSLPVILLTAHGTIAGAVDATRKGVFSYLTKPFDSQQLLTEIQQALQHTPALSSNEEDPSDRSWRANIITQSRLMEELLKQAQRLAKSDVSILIQGASGTGKELLAQAIHKASTRNKHPFVAINCAAIPCNLLESELFGHKKGAFTGADKNHTGMIETANKGSLFLDEIGDMPLDFQVKLLRVLEQRTIRPVGSSQTVDVDVRIVSATHINLEQAVENKTFREDLYYRLNIVILEIPSLHERREDIALLARHFLQKILKKTTHCIAKSFSPEALQRMMTAPWPGNIRQLLNVVEQVAVLSSTPVISEQLVIRALRGKTAAIPPLAKAQQEFEQEYLTRLLQVTEGNVTRAAALAKRNRTEFYKLLNKHHLEAAAFRQSD